MHPRRPCHGLPPNHQLFAFLSQPYSPVSFRNFEDPFELISKCSVPLVQDWTSFS